MADIPTHSLLVLGLLKKALCITQKTLYVSALNVIMQIFNLARLSGTVFT